MCQGRGTEGLKWRERPSFLSSTPAHGPPLSRLALSGHSCLGPGDRLRASSTFWKEKGAVVLNPSALGQAAPLERSTVGAVPLHGLVLLCWSALSIPGCGGWIAKNRPPPGGVPVERATIGSLWAVFCLQPALPCSAFPPKRRRCRMCDEHTLPSISVVLATFQRVVPGITAARGWARAGSAHWWQPLRPQFPSQS